MANEATYAGVADLRTTEALSAEFLQLLAARGSLPSHPALVYAGDSFGDSSLVKRVSHIGLMGYDLLAATADGVAVVNTAITDASTDITLQRYSKSYGRTDMARLTDSRGFLAPQTFARDAVASRAATLINIVANLVDNFSSGVSDTGVNADVSDWFALIGLLEVAEVKGEYLAILHTRQTADIRDDIAVTTSGAIQWLPASREQLELVGDQYRGKFGGVDMFATGHVPTANAGADRAGGMFGRGAILWADSTYPDEGDPNQIIIGGKVLFERDRTPKSGTTDYVTHAMMGASEGIDAAGATLTTDA